MENRLIVALDVSGYELAKKWVDNLKNHVKIFKVGSQLFVSSGPKIIDYIHSKKCEVFLDLKFHDIPNTTAMAVCEAAELGVFMVNVHASGGISMMQTVKEHLDKLPGNIRRPKVLGVTVLTSWDEESFSKMNTSSDIKTHVGFLARLTKQAGLDGVVASGKEISLVREFCGKDFIIVTPGVRPKGENLQDQKRTMNPEEIIKAGADYIVVGRPILNSENPIRMVESILKDISV